MDAYKKITDYLNNCIENDALSQAYFFCGSDDAKTKIALWFAGKIASPPDFFRIKPDEGGNISISSVRQLKKFLILSPHAPGRKKAALIESAEKLNESSQNALLKIMEETPAHGLIILIAKTSDSVLETIASRSVRLHFWRRLPAQPNETKIRGALIKLAKSGFSDRFGIAENLMKNHETVLVFKIWLGLLREALLGRLNLVQNPALSMNNCSVAELIGIFKISQNIYFKLNETQINRKLAYDELILNLK